MKVIIAGAGAIGVALARYLRAENDEIVLIDKDADALGNLSEQLDIQTIQGCASYPSVLERAGAAHADAAALAFEVSPHTREAGQKILILSQFHLRFSVCSASAVGEYVED